MATQKLNITRDQLTTFLKTHELVKQFENLIQTVDDVSPSSDTQGISLQAARAEASANEALAQIVKLAQDVEINGGASDQKAVQALSALERIAHALEVLSTAPIAQSTASDNDVPVLGRWPGVSELTDTSVKLPTAGMLLVYDATLKQWKNATLTPGTNVTITNGDGSITIAASGSASETHAAPSKPTPVDADEIPLADSATLFSLKKLTWANLKATLAAWISGNLIPAFFTTLQSSGLATLGASTGGNQIAGRSHLYAGSLTWFSTVGDGIERIRFGHYDSGSVAFPTGLVSAQVMAGVSALDISTRDFAAAVIRLRAGAGVPVIATVGPIGFSVNTGTLSVPGGATLVTSTSAMTNGSGVSAGTLLNAPVAGNPTKWVAINDGGTTRYIPTW